MRESARIFFRAVAAGIAIAIGGTVYLSVENKIAGSLFFTVGLYAIVLNGLNLYTGRIGYLVEQKEKRSYIWLLFLTWLGNLAGTSLAAVCLFAARIHLRLKSMQGRFARQSLGTRSSAFLSLLSSAAS